MYTGSIGFHMKSPAIGWLLPTCTWIASRKMPSRRIPAMAVWRVERSTAFTTIVRSTRSARSGRTSASRCDPPMKAQSNPSCRTRKSTPCSGKNVIFPTRASSLRFFAARIASGLRSTADTARTRFASAIVTFPLPHPISTTWSSGRSPSFQRSIASTSSAVSPPAECTVMVSSGTSTSRYFNVDNPRPDRPIPDPAYFRRIHSPSIRREVSPG